MEELLKENYFLFSLPNTRMRTELDEIISYPKSYLSSSKSGKKSQVKTIKSSPVPKIKNKVIHYKIFNIRKTSRSSKETMNIMKKLDFIDQGYSKLIISLYNFTIDSQFPWSLRQKLFEYHGFRRCSH